MRPLVRGLLLASFLASVSIAHGDDTLLVALGFVIAGSNAGR